MIVSALCRAALAAGFIASGTQLALAQATWVAPGFPPFWYYSDPCPLNQISSAAIQAASPPPSSGLTAIYQDHGRLRVSVSAAGSNDAYHLIKVTKPTPDATVVKAYLMAAAHDAWALIPEYGDIRLAGYPINWSNEAFAKGGQFANKFFHNVLADVTDIVKPVMDAMPAAGVKTFRVAENQAKSAHIDGEVLAVVFKVATGDSQTVVLMWGAQNTWGDNFGIEQDEPIDPAAPGAKLNMGLGISYSFQVKGCTQSSAISVNGTLVSSAAGGGDDGKPVYDSQGRPENGSLITVGGTDDVPAVPLNPKAPAIDARSDNERYNLLKFIRKTDTSIKVDTNSWGNDNIFFAYFEFSGQGEAMSKDTDGDGLLDSWEISGYDHDGDGKIDVDLPAMGASPTRKDIFIASAWMEPGPDEKRTHFPNAAIRDAITSAFARAPVYNPDGSTGINVHWKKLGGIPFKRNLDLTATNWAAFDKIMDPKVSAAERVIYHRVIHGRQHDGGLASGLSRGVPASDFVETLHSGATVTERASTIMHQLGHNLGLRHGGVDHENYKPNHLSVMNLANQFDGLIKNGQPYLDYESLYLKDLDEAHLNEADGLTSSAGIPAETEKTISEYGVRWFSGGVGKVKKSGADKNVNWNGVGSATQPSVSADINKGDGNRAAMTRLRGSYKEWSYLVFNGGQVGYSIERGKGIHRTLPLPPDALKELSLEDWRNMKSRMIEVK